MKKKNVEEGICGEEMEIFYDGKVKKLNVELVKFGKGWQIHLEDNDRSKILLRLHIKEAVQLKSIIDNLVFDALMEEIHAKNHY